MTTLTISKERAHLLLTLNRPKERNALNTDLIKTLQTALTTDAADPAIRTIILNGAGDHFCAGADIKHMLALSQATHQENVDDATQLATLLWQLYTYPKPIISLCHGATLGGGMGLLAVSDIVIATTSAMFGFSEVKLGIMPAIISPYILRAIGVRAMRRYFLTGERFAASTAEKLGLVHLIENDTDLLASGIRYADTLLQNGPCAIKAIKQLTTHVDTQPLTESYALSMAEQLASIRKTNEAQEGFHAFLEKRAPNWNE